MKHAVPIVLLLSLVMAALRAAADAPPGRYTISSGTVYDTRTALTWQQTPASTSYTQAQAISHCSGLGGGWRIPKVSELLSIVDRLKAAAPAIDLTAFPGTGSEIFWASTPTVSGYAWAVDFTDGRSISQDVTFTFRVRCVR